MGVNRSTWRLTTYMVVCVEITITYIKEEGDALRHLPLRKSLIVPLIKLLYHVQIYYLLAFFSFFAITRYAIGAAKKSDEQVPYTTPRIIANEKLRMLSPPRKKIQRSTTSVLTEVLMVRARVVLSESLKS